MTGIYLWRGSTGEKRLEEGLKQDPWGGATASFAQAFPRAPVCWFLLLCLAFPRARKINVSENPQLPSGAARDFEGKSCGILSIYDLAKNCSLTAGFWRSLLDFIVVAPLLLEPAKNSQVPVSAVWGRGQRAFEWLVAQSTGVGASSPDLLQGKW